MEFNNGGYFIDGYTSYEFVSWRAEANVTYYILVTSTGTVQTGPFRLTVNGTKATYVPPGSNCSAAVPVPSLPFHYNGSIVYQTWSCFYNSYTCKKGTSFKQILYFSYIGKVSGLHILGIIPMLPLVCVTEHLTSKPL